jgi:AGZA family xanthine/uracil permease-like MFS transporter
MGTTLAVGGEAGLLDEEGNMPQINRPFMVDSIARRSARGWGFRRRRR